MEQTVWNFVYFEKKNICYWNVEQTIFATLWMVNKIKDKQSNSQQYKDILLGKKYFYILSYNNYLVLDLVYLLC